MKIEAMFSFNSMIKNSIMAFLVLNSFFIFGQEFQLAFPIIKTQNCIFEDSMKVALELDIPGVKLYYALDGSEPNEQSMLYRKPFSIKEDVVLKIKAFHEDFISSETKSLEFINKGNKIHFKELTIESYIPNEYKANGSYTLFDNNRGSLNHRDGKWIATKGSDLTIEIVTKEKISEGELIVGLLKKSGSWIFGPQEIVVSGYNDATNEFQLVQSENIDPILELDPAQMQFAKIPFHSDFSTSKFKIEMKKTEILPDWHPGDSGNTWIFVDEIIIK